MYNSVIKYLYNFDITIKLEMYLITLLYKFLLLKSNFFLFGNISREISLIIEFFLLIIT